MTSTTQHPSPHVAQHRRPRRNRLLRRPAVASSLVLAAVASTGAGYSAVHAQADGVDGRGALAAVDATFGLADSTPTSSPASQTTAPRHDAPAVAVAGNARTQVRAAQAHTARVQHAMVTARRAGHGATAAVATMRTHPSHRTSSAASTAAASTTPAPVSSDPRSIAAAMLSSYGWSSSQLSCLSNLWNRESGWKLTATNRSSGAYGIPQALPGSKMASAGADWRTNPATQIRWGLGYIRSSYSSPCGAWSHSLSTGWY